jgi:hypothetical protein
LNKQKSPKTIREIKHYLFSSWKRITLFCLLILLPALVLITVNLLSSLHYMKLLSNPVLNEEPKKAAKKSPNPATLQPGNSAEKAEINDLLMDRSFWRNRLRIAKTDSISLAINLPDSVISIDIKGVSVRSCKIRDYQVSSILKYAREKGALNSWFANSFILQDYWATLPKAPIKVKEAPADTNEAKDMVDATPPIEKQDVRLILQFNKNLIIQIDQTEPFVFTGWFEKHFRNVQFRLEKGFEFIHTLTKLRWPEPELRIKIDISQSDAKAVFRALPQKAEAVIRL